MLRLFVKIMWGARGAGGTRDHVTCAHAPMAIIIFPQIDMADCRSLVTKKCCQKSHEPIRFVCDDVTTNLIG